MIGRNQILMNEAEMQKAVDYYLNEVQFKKRVKVVGVRELAGSPIKFEIVLEEGEEKDEPKE